ncbi:MAG: PQQ-binding-like beta-propeller repeat protein [Solirubrobacteraceae bacterium]|nr:MAG: hypothetical protein DLM63_04460 [Solirubrobacterales bacterium]
MASVAAAAGAGGAAAARASAADRLGANPPVPGSTWTTFGGDPGRTNADANPAAPLPFAPAWTSPLLDGDVYGQPLQYGGLVYVATENNSVYALDATTGRTVWQDNVGLAAPSNRLACGNIEPRVGITSTPVIDPASSAIYVVADTWDGQSNAQHVLAGYDLASGRALFAPRPVDPADGDSPNQLLQRPALALDGGEVIIGYGGNDADHGEQGCDNYHGAVVAAPLAGGANRTYHVTDPQGAIWGTSGPAVDGHGSIYVSSGDGNGSLTSAFGQSNAVIELDAALSQQSFFTPAAWKLDDLADLDLGSTGPLLLPGGLLYQDGKDAQGYLLSADDLGGIGGQLYSAPVCQGFGGDAYAAGHIYVGCIDGTRALALDSANRRFAVLWQAPATANGPPVVAGGLVWTIGYYTSQLYGFDPASGALKVQQPLAEAMHFASAGVADGRLLVPAGQVVSAFTIASPPPGSDSPLVVVGGSRCRVPRLRFYSLTRARRALARAGCRLGRVYRPHTLAASRRALVKGVLVVLRQSPPAGVSLAPGTRINLRLGHGPPAAQRRR